MVWGMRGGWQLGGGGVATGGVCQWQLVGECGKWGGGWQLVGCGGGNW